MTVAAVDWKTIKDALWQWFSEVSGLTTIWSNQSGPQPLYPYATLLITAGTRAQGALDEERFGTDGTLKIVGQQDFNLSCQIHVGPPQDQGGECDAHSRMSTVLASVALPKYKALFEEAKIGLRDRSNPQELNLVVGTEWINRVQASLRFGMASTLKAEDIGADPGYFDKVEVSSDLEPLQGSGGLNLDKELLDPNA